MFFSHICGVTFECNFIQPKIPVTLATSKQGEHGKSEPGWAESKADDADDVMFHWDTPYDSYMHWQMTLVLFAVDIATHPAMNTSLPIQQVGSLQTPEIKITLCFGWRSYVYPRQGWQFSLLFLMFQKCKMLLHVMAHQLFTANFMAVSTGLRIGWCSNNRR